MAERIGTTCVQGGYRPGDGEPRQVPIYQSTTWKYDTSEHMGRLFDLEEAGYFYTRLQNPTNDAVAAKICELEGGTAGMLTSSGQAANFFALFNIMGAGDHVVASSAIYGGTYNLIAHTMRRMGIESTFVAPDCTDEELEAAFQPNTKAVFGETIANPALDVLDIERFAAAAHAHGVPLIVDNTFPTPVMCRPIEWGVDIVTHSTTKYMPNGNCGVVSFGFTGGRAAAEQFMKSLHVAQIATHVADARTCVLHPANATHRQMTDEELAAAGIAPDMVRLSCGIEDTEDLIADVAQALDTL